MAVIINLKEIFATDSQSVASDKLNFNFNQLIALGIGQPGPIGPAGPTGAAGPAGPIGPAGPTGTVIFGQTTAVAPIVPPSNVPTGLVTGDILIGSDKIYKKTLTGWLELVDFNTLVVSAIGANISPFLRLGGSSRIVKHRVSNGIDLTNSATQSDPTYPTPGVGTNYQTILYNFNELKTRSFKLDQFGNITIANNAGSEKTFIASNGAIVNLTNNQITINSHGFSNGTYVTYTAEGGTAVGGLTDNTGYYVISVSSNILQLCETAADVINNNPIDLTSLGSGSSAHKLTSYPSPTDTIFPATSNLSLYSFYDNSATSAKEFETNPTAKGYRAQLEIGSVDTLSAAYPGGLSSTNYLISPSFENLRIRKYRIGGFSIAGGSAQNPGTYMIRAEYDLSSSGLETNASFSPRRNSEHVWRINKAGVSQAVGRTIEMKLTNSHVLDNTESALGISLDGIFVKRNPTFDGSSGTIAAFGIGFNAANNGVSFLGSSGVTGFSFNKSVFIEGAGQTTTVSASGITGVNSAGTWSIVAPAGSMLISSNGTMTMQSPGNFVIQTTNPAGIIRLNQAIKVREDRLDAGLPFPVTQVVSADANTLDDYREGTWGYSGNLGLMSVFRGYCSISECLSPVWYDLAGIRAANTSTVFYSADNRYTKVGNLVTCTINYMLDLYQLYDYTPTTPAGSSAVGYPGWNQALYEDLLGINLPFPAKSGAPICGTFELTDPGIALLGQSAMIQQAPSAAITTVAPLLAMNAVYDSVNEVIVYSTPELCPSNILTLGPAGGPVYLRISGTFSYFSES